MTVSLVAEETQLRYRYRSKRHSIAKMGSNLPLGHRTGRYTVFRAAKRLCTFPLSLLAAQRQLPPSAARGWYRGSIRHACLGRWTVRYARNAYLTARLIEANRAILSAYTRTGVRRATRSGEQPAEDAFQSHPPSLHPSFLLRSIFASMLLHFSSEVFGFFENVALSFFPTSSQLIFFVLDRFCFGILKYYNSKIFLELLEYIIFRIYDYNIFRILVDRKCSVF